MGLLRRFFSLAVVILLSYFAVLAQAPPSARYHPTHNEMLARYQAVAQKDSIAKNTVYKAVVKPHWLPGSKAFWYQNNLQDSTLEYLLVNAATGSKRKAFNEGALAAALNSAGHSGVNKNRLWVSNLSFNKEATDMTFAFGKKYYRFNTKTNALTAIDSLPDRAEDHHQFNEPPSRWENYETDSLSPNHQYVAYIKDNNVYIRPISGGDAVQYTHDGSNAHPYGSLAWSPDSKCVVGYHITPVEDSAVYYVLSSVAGTTRGQLQSHPYKQPGDPFTTYVMYLFPVEQMGAVKVNTDTLDFFDAPRLHWTKDNSHFYYEKMDRGHQRFRILEVEIANGHTRTIVDEQTKTFIYTNRIFTQYLPQTDEIVWTSEKDNWRHLYLVDARTGNIKHQITKGEYVVKDIDSVDEQKREIWFSANGMNKGEDPYYVHVYRIDFDGNNLVDLTPAHATHTVSFSPDKSYYLDTYSDINSAPVTELRSTATGKKIAEIERADISTFMSIVKRLPQPFVAKGRDGVTDIYGIVCLPADFDSSQTYPIVENIYAGPQDAFVPKSFMPYYSEMQSLADLGFMVVQIDGMGTANRSKAFHDVCWKNLADAGFPDRILWMKALAAKYSYVDTSRVGLYGTSAGGQNCVGWFVVSSGVVQSRRGFLRLPRQPHRQTMVERTMDGLSCRSGV